MAVLLSDGRKKLKENLHFILNRFVTDEDCARGVFIKPNIVFPVKPESGEITAPMLVRTLISALRERYPMVEIMLGEGVAAGCDPQENFRTSGYADLASELDVPLLDLHGVERKAVVWKFGTLQLPRVVLERTYINLPILKPSSACVISGALKNQKGLVLPSIKKKFHCLGLHEQIAELNVVVKPALTILDGSRLLGRGLLISGNNCGEIDSTACELLGIDEPEHVQLSRSAGIFAPGYAVAGSKIYNKRASSRLKAKECKHVGRLRLWSNPRACTMCRYLFHQIKRDALRPADLSAKMRLLSYSIQGAEIVMGRHPQWRREYNNVICVGNCTRSMAREYGYAFIPGCPPTLRDVYDSLQGEERLGKSAE